ncbi:MAG: PHP domain-containing protein [Candidatus Edwardsbacteria bacterium]|nr:PHP domain-containing protein [Candidatus Edwardsbacteria bacterium]
MTSQQYFVDLHIHTAASDGIFTPQELVKQASLKGLKAIAITDHDAWDAIEPISSLAFRVGIEVIPGIELSTNIEGAEIHILGYFIDYTQSQFQERVLHFKNARIERAHRMVEKLAELGVRLEIARVLEIAGSGSVGRPHVARALAEEGYVGGTDEAFTRYLGNGCPAYVPKNFLTPRESFDLVHSVGGLAFFAHPGIENRDGLIDRFVSQGLDGLEVWHSKHSNSQVKNYLDLARQKNLLVCGGSDCHSDNLMNNGGGSVKVPYSVVEEMKRHLANKKQKQA